MCAICYRAVDRLAHQAKAARLRAHVKLHEKRPCCHTRELTTGYDFFKEISLYQNEFYHDFNVGFPVILVAISIFHWTADPWRTAWT